jgi:hypothetical protein
MLGSLGTLFAQVGFENDRVPGIGFVYSIGKITNEWNKTNDEIDYHVDHHLHAQGCGESAVNSFT